ncbi:hypothetical protein V8C86DRAFT_163682 [Haematococcus lacustris]
MASLSEQAQPNGKRAAKRRWAPETEDSARARLRARLAKEEEANLIAKEVKAGTADAQERDAQIRAIFGRWAVRDVADADAFAGLLRSAADDLASRRLAARLIPRHLHAFPALLEQAAVVLIGLHASGAGSTGSDEAAAAHATRLEALQGLSSVLQAATQLGDRGPAIVLRVVHHLMRRLACAVHEHAWLAPLPPICVRLLCPPPTSLPLPLPPGTSWTAAHPWVWEQGCCLAARQAQPPQPSFPSLGPAAQAGDGFGPRAEADGEQEALEGEPPPGSSGRLSNGREGAHRSGRGIVKQEEEEEEQQAQGGSKGQGGQVLLLPQCGGVAPGATGHVKQEGRGDAHGSLAAGAGEGADREGGALGARGGAGQGVGQGAGVLPSGSSARYGLSNGHAQPGAAAATEPHAAPAKGGPPRGGSGGCCQPGRGCAARSAGGVGDKGCVGWGGAGEGHRHCQACGCSLPPATTASVNNVVPTAPSMPPSLNDVEAKQGAHGEADVKMDLSGSTEQGAAAAQPPSAAAPAAGSAATLPLAAAVGPLEALSLALATGGAPLRLCGAYRCREWVRLQALLLLAFRLHPRCFLSCGLQACKAAALAAGAQPAGGKPAHPPDEPQGRQ